MGTIMARQTKDGAKSFTAVIRQKKGGKIVLTLSDTFPIRQAVERSIGCKGSQYGFEPRGSRASGEAHRA